MLLNNRVSYKKDTARVEKTSDMRVKHLYWNDSCAQNDEDRSLAVICMSIAIYIFALVLSFDEARCAAAPKEQVKGEEKQAESAEARKKLEKAEGIKAKEYKFIDERNKELKKIAEGKVVIKMLGKTKKSKDGDSSSKTTSEDKDKKEASKDKQKDASKDEKEKVSKKNTKDKSKNKEKNQKVKKEKSKRAKTSKVKSDDVSTKKEASHEDSSDVLAKEKETEETKDGKEIEEAKETKETKETEEKGSDNVFDLIARNASILEKRIKDHDLLKDVKQIKDEAESLKTEFDEAKKNKQTENMCKALAKAIGLLKKLSEISVSIVPLMDEVAKKSLFIEALAETLGYFKKNFDNEQIHEDLARLEKSIRGTDYAEKMDSAEEVDKKKKNDDLPTVQSKIKAIKSDIELVDTTELESEQVAKFENVKKLVEETLEKYTPSDFVASAKALEKFLLEYEKIASLKTSVAQAPTDATVEALYNGIAGGVLVVHLDEMRGVLSDYLAKIEKHLKILTEKHSTASEDFKTKKKSAYEDHQKHVASVSGVDEKDKKRKIEKANNLHKRKMAAMKNEVDDLKFEKDELASLVKSIEALIKKIDGTIDETKKGKTPNEVEKAYITILNVYKIVQKEFFEEEERESEWKKDAGTMPTFDENLIKKDMKIILSSTKETKNSLKKQEKSIESEESEKSEHKGESSGEKEESSAKKDGLSGE